jgi:hypothetical protein
MDPLLFTETNERIDELLASDPSLTEDDAIQLVVHAGIVHDLHPCTSRLCAAVTKHRAEGR